MSETHLKESDYFIAWLLFFICATIGGVVAGFIAGAIVGFLLGALGVGQAGIQTVGGTMGFLTALPVSYFCFRVMVAKFVVDKLLSAVNVRPPAY